MTLQEIKERIAVYESKWGKLGHTNIMKPENEIQHSALNERRNTMIKTTNDFYKFRQKVAIGNEANKLAHKATISPEELNERNFQNQLDNNTLIHAGKNFKYVAKEDVNGKPRYFYTQEEYDAFKNTGKSAGNAGDMAGKLVKSAANDVFKPENDRSKAVENYNNNAKDDSIRVIVEASKNGGGKAAASAFTNTPAWKNGLEIYEYVINQGYDPRTISSNQTKSLGKDFNDFVKQIEDETNEYVKALPNDMQKDFIDECRRLSEKELDKLMKKETVLESVGDKLGEDLNKGIAKSNIGEAVTKNIKHSAFDEEDETPSYKTAADLRQEREESIMSEYRAFKARANKGAEKNRLSHSAVISPRDLNAKYEEELMKEYIAIHPENDDDIEHSSNGRAYINKIDKYYPDGSARYFYTQAEWDAYQEGLKRSQYESNKKAQESEKRISDYNAKKEADSRNNMGGYADFVAKQKREKQIADAKARVAERERKLNEAKLASQKAEASRRSGMDDYEEYQKEQKAEKEANAKKIAEERAEASKRYDDAKNAAIKAGQKSEQDRQKLEEAKKNVNKEIDELRNNANDNVYDGTDLSNALKRNLNQDKIDDFGSELGGILTEYYKVIDNNDDSDEGSKLKRKALDEYFNKRDKILEKYGIEFGSKEYADALKVSEEIEKEYEKKHKYDTSADARIKKNIKEQEYNNKKN